MAIDGERVSASYVEREDPGLHRAALRLVGNWTAALRAAGLDPREHCEPKKWSLEHVVEWVRETYADGGDIRSSAAPDGALQRVAMETGQRWIEFIESLGMEYPGQKKRLDWTDAAVLAEIRRRHRRRLALNDTAVRSEVPGLVQQGRKRFGSWDGALRAAGLDPERIRLSGAWTHAGVLTAIQARAAAGKSLRRKDVLAEDKRLVKAATRLFPSSWARALDAAGLGPASVRCPPKAAGSRPRKPK